MGKIVFHCSFDMSLPSSFGFILKFKSQLPTPHCAACGISVPRPGIEPGPTAVKAVSSNHWITRGSPRANILWTFFFFFSRCPQVKLEEWRGRGRWGWKKKMAGWWCWTKRDFGEGKEHTSYALKLSSCLKIMLPGQHHGTFDRQGGGSVNEGLRSLRKTRGGSGEWGWRERYKHVVQPWNNGGTIQETMSNCLPLLPQWVKTGRSLWHTEGCPFQPTGPMMIAQNN